MRLLKFKPNLLTSQKFWESGVKAYRTKTKVFDKERTVLITYNDELFTTQMKTLSNQIEKAFRQMKDPYFVCWYPQFHWTDQKIRVHAFYCVLALTLVSLLNRELKLKGINISISEMLKQIKDIKETLVIKLSDKKRTIELQETNKYLYAYAFDS